AMVPALPQVYEKRSSMLASSGARPDTSRAKRGIARASPRDRRVTHEGGRVRTRVTAGALIALVAALAVVAAGYGKSGHSVSAQVLPSSSCGPLVYSGPVAGKPQYIIASDLPL